ncbi:MAG: Omp28-related outer membrane protein [Dysgonamonadaceae bacterium]|jgi:hypothetical protein|nr:Omp28-related outer membrane protein [Dysgonamonadaceae bacterium]
MRKTFIFLVCVCLFVISSVSVNAQLSQRPVKISGNLSVAASNEFLFGFCNSGEIRNSIGMGTPTEIPAAILMSASKYGALAGMKISKIRIGLAADCSNVSVWIRSSLTGVNLVSKQVGNLKAGWSEVTLNEPFVIPSGDIYIGYTATGEYQCAFSGEVEEDANWLWSSDGAWGNYAVLKYGSLCIIAVIDTEGVPFYDAGIASLKKTYIEINKPFTIKCSIRNTSSEKITSLKLSYKIGNESPVERTLRVSIDPLKLVPFEIQVAPIAAALGSYPLSLTILEVNGNPDTYLSNNTLTDELDVLAHIFPKKVVVEEGTGTWCQWCTRGIVGMAMMKERYPETFIGIAVHNNDPMTVSAYDRIMQEKFFTDYPSMVVSRKSSLTGDPYYDIENFYEKEIDVPAQIGIELKGMFTDDEKNKLTLKTTTTFGYSGEANFKLAYVLIENNIIESDQAYWQSNAYSGGNNGEMGGYENKPSKIKNQVYNDVARGIYSVFTGITGSIPAQVIEMEPVDHTYTLTLPSNVLNKDNLEVAVLLLDSNGEIVNADKVEIKDVYNSVTFSYCDDVMSEALTYSAGTATVRVAIKIPQEVAAKYANAKITKIHAGIGAATSNTKVFIAEGLENNTLVCSQDATFAQDSWNTVTLEDPYTVTGTCDLLVGYEYRGSGAVIGVDGTSEVFPNSNYYSEPNGQWNIMSTNNWSIKATIKGDSIPESDISLLSVMTNFSTVSPDEQFDVVTTVYNNASMPVKNFKINYAIGNINGEENITGIKLAPFRKYTFSKGFSISEEGYYQVTASISEPNGKPDEDASDNSLSAENEIWVGNGVPKNPSKRNVLLEEFTGIHCTWCPDGHKRANQLKAKYLGRVDVINIHQGTYAIPNTGEPDFRTAFGDAIVQQSGTTGYPSGTVNRHVFTGGKTVLDRGAWERYAPDILNDVSPVNLAAKAHIDWDTRTLTVDVDGYYTANSNAQTNKLNVALLQDNILGPQVGSSLYPAMVENGLYRHNHMLRHLLSGQWGTTIQPTEADSSFTRQYVYVIPEAINKEPIYLDNLKIVAFIAEGNQEVITTTEARLKHTYLTTPTIEILDAEQLVYNSADDEILVQVIVRSISTTPITSYQLQYGINSTETHTVSGKNMECFDKDTLLLPLIPIELKKDKTLMLSVSQVNGGEPGRQSSFSLKVKKDLSFVESSKLTLNLWQDRYGSEITWKWFSPNGEVIFSGGPYSDLSKNTTELHKIELPLPVDGVYRFEIYDSYGDGINNGAGAGKYEMRAEDNTLVTSDDGKFGKKGMKYIGVKKGLAIHHPEAKAYIAVSISDDILYIDSAEPVQSVTVYNLSGRKVLSQENGKRVIPVDMLPVGVYIVKVKTANGEQTLKAVR